MSNKKVCFMFVNSAYTLDGIRSVLGLSVEDHYSFGAVINNVELPEFDDYNRENLEWVRDMEGDVMSTVPANAEKNGLTAITVEELGEKLRDMDVIVPYGIMRPEGK